MTQLLLPDNRLAGEIPPEFGNLLHLTALDLTGNQLSGCIPVALFYRGQLRGQMGHPRSAVKVEPLTACPEPERENLVAVFEAMGLEEHPGPIGTWPGVKVDQSAYVKTLDLIGIAGQVPVPAELTRLSRLQVLFMQGSGELPPALGQISTLKFLQISRGPYGKGELTGQIPPELGDLSNLTRLVLSSNELSGEIPVELGKLSKLTFLGLSGNQLSGAIPAELGQLSSLVSAGLGEDSLTGCLPSNWPVRRVGSFPVCSAATDRITQQQADREFQVLAALYEDGGGPRWDRETKKNWLSDRPLGEWAGVGTDDQGYVISLEISSGANGTLPAELGDLTYLRTLRVDGSWNGGIPPELGNLSHLTQLYISGIDGEGAIPRELGNLAQLRSLRLVSNDLTGEIPAELGKLSNLRRLNLGGNRLTGEIPKELGNLTGLQELQLARNEFAGEVPQELWELPDLEFLSLDRQNYGCIPAKLKDQLLTFGGRSSDLIFCPAGDSP